MALADQPFLLGPDQIQLPRYPQADKEDNLLCGVRAAEKSCFGSCQNTEGPWTLPGSTIGPSVRNQDLIHNAATYDRRSKQEPFFFRGQMHVHFPIFLLLPILLLSFTASSPFNHSIDTSRCYGTFNILLSVIGRPKRIPEQPTPRILLSSQESRYRHCYLSLLNVATVQHYPLLIHAVQHRIP